MPTRIWPDQATRKRFPWRWVAAGFTGAGFLAAAALWLSFQRIPAWYRPVQIAAVDVQRVRDDLVRTLYDAESGAPDSFAAAIAVARDPFEYRLRQDRLNAWLAIREEIWPLSRHWLGRAISNPVVVLGEDGIRVAVTYTRGSLQTVLSARFEVGIEDGLLHVRLAEAGAGTLPAPESWIRDWLATAELAGWPAGTQSPFQLDDTPLPPLSDLPDGAFFPSAWIWHNGKRPFRITDLRLEPGTLVLTIAPLPQRPRN